jgi:hypothetical protein
MTDNTEDKRVSIRTKEQKVSILARLRGRTPYQFEVFDQHQTLFISPSHTECIAWCEKNGYVIT